MRLTACLAIVALALIYSASYVALVSPSVYENSTHYPGQVTDRYPLAEKAASPLLEACRIAYAPVNWCDRHVRPKKWACPACVW
jgi:hypothetical protein